MESRGSSSAAQQQTARSSDSIVTNTTYVSSAGHLGSTSDQICHAHSIRKIRRRSIDTCSNPPTVDNYCGRRVVGTDSHTSHTVTLSYEVSPDTLVFNRGRHHEAGGELLHDSAAQRFERCRSKIHKTSNCMSVHGCTSLAADTAPKLRPRLLSRCATKALLINAASIARWSTVGCS